MTDLRVRWHLKHGYMDDQDFLPQVCKVLAFRLVVVALIACSTRFVRLMDNIRQLFEENGTSLAPIAAGA